MKIWCQLPVKLLQGDPRIRAYYSLLEKHYNLVKRKDTEIVIRDVLFGPSKPEWQDYAGLRIFNDVGVLKSVLAAEREGFDGVSIACFFDPVLSEARQLLKIPVTGLAESSLYLAGMMGTRFAIIAADVRHIPVMEEHIARYGVESKAIRHHPVRALTVSKEEVRKSHTGEYASLVENFKEIAAGCVEDGAEVLIAGCGLVSPVLVQAGLTEVNGAAIIEPLIASLKLTELLVDLQKAKIPIVSRKSSYLTVPSKDIKDALSLIG